MSQCFLELSLLYLAPPRLCVVAVSSFPISPPSPAQPSPAQPSPAQPLMLVANIIGFQNEYKNGKNVKNGTTSLLNSEIMTSQVNIKHKTTFQKVTLSECM